MCILEGDFKTLSIGKNPGRNEFQIKNKLYYDMSFARKGILSW